MRYKTTIKIVAEARDRNEAIEMADDYLAGNLSSGIDMRCSTRPACSDTVRVVSAVAVSVVLLFAVLVAPQFRQAAGILPSGSGASAIQPPLKTSAHERLSAEFKREWQDKQIAQALNAIR